MDTQHHEEQIGGMPVRVSDCHIWAAIHYLDSPTDYREHLPQYQEKLRLTSDLVMLGEERPSAWITGLQVIVGAGLTSIVLSLLMRACD